SRGHRRRAQGGARWRVGHAIRTTHAVTRRLLGASAIALIVMSARIEAQLPGLSAPAPPAAEAPKDSLGRSRPPRAVLGVLAAGRKGDDDLARRYLNPTLKGDPAEKLAHQLFVVLDARLPPRLTQVSDAPDGSRVNPLEPDREVVGTITGASGAVEIVVERVA